MTFAFFEFLSSSDSILRASAFLAIAAAWCIMEKVSNKKKPWKMVPGRLPIVGHYLQVRETTRLCEVLERWARDQEGITSPGCFEVDLMGNRIVAVCSEDRAMEILEQRPYCVQRNTNLREAADSTGATGVFSAEGSQWKEEKKLIAAALNRHHMNDFLPTMKEIATRLVQKWNRDISSNSKNMQLVSISLDIGHMAADAVCMAIANKDFDFLNNPESKIANDVFQGFRGWLFRAMSPIWYWRIPVIGQDLDGYGKYYRFTNEIFNGIVDDFERCQKTTTTKANDINPSSPKNMFLGKLYKAMEQEKSKLSRDRVVGNICTAFMAGIDTTSKTLISALHLLACDKSLQQELRDHVKDFDISYSSLQDVYAQLPVLKSFLHEVHRWYSVPLLLLRTSADIPFCGTTLPAGQDIALLGRYICTKEGANGVPLGPDKASPAVFSHRRYLVPMEEGNISSTIENRDLTSCLKWSCPGPIDKGTAFLSFGHGVRKCPGRVYSEALTCFALISILQSFDFDLAPNHPQVKIVFDTVMTPDKPIQLKLAKVKDT